MSLNKTYRERFLKRLEELTAEELKRIFDKVLENKCNEERQLNNNVLINLVSDAYKTLKFVDSAHEKRDMVTITSSKIFIGTAYKESNYRMPKNMQGLLQKAS